MSRLQNDVQASAVGQHFRVSARRAWRDPGLLPVTLALAILLPLVAACGSGTAGTVTVVSYNVQNLYDATADGGEFREFTAGGGWTQALYTAKLRALGTALRTAVPGGADLVALQEVEHAGPARRLLELELAQQGYRHLVWLPDPAGATGPVVLSKLPVRRVGALWVEPAPDLPLRPILEVEVALGPSPEAPSLFLFNNHWKSKHGGAAETESYRRRAAALLAARLRQIHAADPAADVIVVGDLNESVDEYERQARRYPTALLPPSAAAVAAGAALLVTAGDASGPPGGDGTVTLFSPWFVHAETAAQPPGSYRYRGNWETIDHVLLGPGLFDDRGVSYPGPDGFAVISDGLLDRRGTPRPFQRGPPPSGYSDHLPLRLTLLLN